MPTYTSIAAGYANMTAYASSGKKLNEVDGLGFEIPKNIRDLDGSEAIVHAHMRWNPVFYDPMINTSNSNTVSSAANVRPNSGTSAVGRTTMKSSGFYANAYVSTTGRTDMLGYKYPATIMFFYRGRESFYFFGAEQEKSIVQFDTTYNRLALLSSPVHIPVSTIGRDNGTGILTVNTTAPHNLTNNAGISTLTYSGGTVTATQQWYPNIVNATQFQMYAGTGTITPGTPATGYVYNYGEGAPAQLHAKSWFVGTTYWEMQGHTEINDGKDHHIAIVLESSEVYETDPNLAGLGVVATLYVDGIFQGRTGGPWESLAGSFSYPGDPGASWGGVGSLTDTMPHLSHLAIFKRAFTQPEIAAVSAHASLPPNGRGGVLVFDGVKWRQTLV